VTSPLRDTAPPPFASAGAAVWNVCLTHDPALAGLYRAVNDFSRALDAPILSFDDGGSPRSDLTAVDHAVRIPCGTGPLARSCHVMTRAAAEAAAATLGDAQLLVVHSMFRAHATWAADWVLSQRRRYWSVPHGCLDPWGLAHRGLAKRAWLTVHGRRFFANAERIVFSTQRALDKARPWVRGGQAAVVHWPVAIPSLHGRDEARVQFRKPLGIPADAQLLLFVGRLHAVKRPIETIRCFCAAETGAAHLVMVCGDGDAARRQLAAAIPASHAARIHLVGPFATSDLHAAYLASDGFVSLSYQENFGYAAAEAAAYGLPVILSPGHDLAYDMPRDSAGELACGWLVPDDSRAAAEQAIGEWASLAAGSPAAGKRLAAMGATGRAWAAEFLSFETFQTTLRHLARV
jgi:glycosyltransferase involved in cell wall biosynthesis